MSERSAARHPRGTHEVQRHHDTLTRDQRLGKVLRPAHLGDQSEPVNHVSAGAHADEVGNVHGGRTGPCEQELADGAHGGRKRGPAKEDDINVVYAFRHGGRSVGDGDGDGDDEHCAQALVATVTGKTPGGHAYARQ